MLDPKIHVLKASLSCSLVLGGRALGTWFSHESEAFMGGIHTHIQTASESSFTYTGGERRKMNQEARSQDTESVGILSLDLAVSRTVRNSILVLMITQPMVIHYSSLNGPRHNLWRPSPRLFLWGPPLLLFLWGTPPSPCLFFWGPSSCPSFGTVTITRLFLWRPPPSPCLFYPIDLPHPLKWSWALETGTELYAWL